MSENYEFFKKEFEFTGKHARMASELWIRDDLQNSFFRRLIDLYILAAVVGCRTERKAPADTSSFEPKSVFPEQMIKEKDKLDYIMQMMLLTEYADTKTPKECVKIAFRGAETKEQYDSYYAMFNDYVRGGVEVLYQALIVRKPEPEEDFSDVKAANINAFLKDFRS